ncbi:MAG: transaldolase [Acidimicrobiales bacterium]
MTNLDILYRDFGQSPWIDNIRRDWLKDGSLKRLVDEGVRGVTSNPSIFAKSLATTSAYNEFLLKNHAQSPEELFETLAVYDVRDACAILRGVHESSRKDFLAGKRRYLDGFVSLEVSPLLARDTQGTITAAKRLHQRVGSENLMVKIPATKEGLPAITEVLGQGINVNVTLIFSVERYGEVLDAWMSGLELARKNRRDVSSIASVASFFVSRVDAAVDPLLLEGDPRRGTTANAQVCAAYKRYADTINEPRALGLIAAGAQVQRPLWASTSTKNPSYFDLLYVDPIVGNETVNTMPDQTLEALLDHGRFWSKHLSSYESVAREAKKLEFLPPFVSLSAVTEKLERDGVDAFVKSYDECLAIVKQKIDVVRG